MKKSPPVTRDELRRLRARLERLEAFQNHDGPELRWCQHRLGTHEGDLGALDGRLGRVERQLAAILHAAEANPEALREVVLAVLEGKEPP